MKSKPLYFDESHGIAHDLKWTNEDIQMYLNDLNKGIYNGSYGTTQALNIKNHITKYFLPSHKGIHVHGWWEGG